MMRPESSDCQEELNEGSDQHLDMQSEPILFNWKDRWLKGHEYEFILKNVEAYSKKFGIEKYGKKCHPSIIYDQPVSTFLEIQMAVYTLFKAEGLDRSSVFRGWKARKSSVGRK